MRGHRTGYQYLEIFFQNYARRIGPKLKKRTLEHFWKVSNVLTMNALFQ